MTLSATLVPDPELLAVVCKDVPRVDVGPGCYRRDLPSREGVRMWVVEIEAGAQWPRIDQHDRLGEDIYVVAGELIEGSRSYPAGTFIAFAPESAHRPRSDTGVVLFGVNLLETGTPGIAAC